MASPSSSKNYAATVVLTVLLGYLGAHRFYVGKVGTGIIYLFTAGLLGIGWIIDIFTVLFGNFTDKTGSFVKPKGQMGTIMTDDVTQEAANKKGLPWWGWALIAVVALGAISSAFGGGNDSDSVEAETSESSVSQEAEANQPAEAPAEAEADLFADETAGEENARRSAENYLSFSPFSRSGLVEQLLFEGFTQAEAEYGVDVLSADWNEQAAKSADNYLSFSAFSRSGLIDQLVFEGFSDSEAQYGVDSVGADWNEQAAKSAENYLEFSSFSRQGLIDQLVFEGFTQAEAEYGVSQNGF
jgi:TM2 domain-containing membrane protein YozV